MKEIGFSNRSLIQSGSSINLQKLTPIFAWLSDYNSDNTRQTYIKALDEFLQFRGFPAFHNMNTDELSKVFEVLRTTEGLHITTFKRMLKDQKKLSNRTINNRLASLSMLFDTLINEQIMRHNPAKAIKRFRVNNEKVESRVLSNDEVRAMLDAPLLWNDHRRKGQHPISELQMIRDRAILHMFFYRGCRVSELCKIKVKDFYQNSGFWGIRLHQKGGETNFSAVGQNLVISLEEYISLRGHGDIKESPLFLALNELFHTKLKNYDPYRQLSRHEIARLWHKYANFCDIKDSSPHSARATYITNAFENGADIMDIKDNAGHKQVRTTQSYVKSRVDVRRSAGLKVGYY